MLSDKERIWSKMKDRLQQLRDAAHVTGEEDLAQTMVIPADADQDEAELAGYFDNVDDLRRSITIIGQKLEQVRSNHNILLTKPRNDALQQETDQLIQQIKVQALKINNTLKKMAEELSHMEASQQRNQTDVRIKRAQYNTLVKQFRDTMYEYNTLTEEYRTKSKDRIRRQLELANREVTEDQLEEILDNPDTNIFTQDILVDSAQWQQALSEIQARNQELRILQTTMQELYEMFLTMATLVEEQGEAIDRIEDNVNAAADHVQRGTHAVRTAVPYARRNRKLTFAIVCIIVGVVLVVIVIVAIIIAVVVAMTNR